MVSSLSSDFNQPVFYFSMFILVITGLEGFCWPSAEALSLPTARFANLQITSYFPRTLLSIAVRLWTHCAVCMLQSPFGTFVKFDLVLLNANVRITSHSCLLVCNKLIAVSSTSRTARSILIWAYRTCSYCVVLFGNRLFCSVCNVMCCVRCESLPCEIGWIFKFDIAWSFVCAAK